MKYLILENIRSAYNVGAIFRTADGAGVSKIFLIGYTPAPLDRFGRVQPEIQKTSLGASVEILWEHHQSSLEVTQKLKADGFKIVVVEQTPDSISLRNFIVPEKVVYIVGNEVGGVEAETINLADYVVDIPMLGFKESLNVSTATGIVLYKDLI